MKLELVRDLIIRSGANKPNKIAYICGEKSISWSQIDQRSNAAGAVFQSLGLGIGGAIGILAPETLEVYEHFFACFKIGAVRVGINRRFTAAEILHIVQDGDLKMIMLHADCAAMAQEIRDELDATDVVLIGYGGEHGMPHDYESLIANVTTQVIYPDLYPDSPAMYTYTSGTTGVPKGVVLSGKAIKTVIDHSAGCFGFAPDDVFYCPLANSWAAVITNLLGLANGMTFVVPDKEYDTVAFLHDVERLKITSFLLAPTMLQWALDELQKKDFDVSSVRLVMYGSAPATPRLIADVSKRFACGMLQAYGTSESAAGWISSLSPEDHRRGLTDKPKLLESAGRVPSYFDISIRDDDGIEVAQGEVGEVWVRSDTIMSAYLNLPDQTAEVLQGDWLITNDMGVLDEDGYLYLKDRRKFMIVSGGINVFPAGVEAILSSHPAIAEIAVVGVPHVVWGEAVIAVVYLREGFDEFTVQQAVGFCAGKLAKVMLPKYIHITDEPLPKSANLKMQKNVIQGWFKEQPDLLPQSFR